MAVAISLSLYFSLALFYLYVLIFFSFSCFFSAYMTKSIVSNTHTEFLPGTTKHRIMKDEEAQRLLGNSSNNDAKDLPTDSKTTTKKKGYSSVVRLPMAFGTFAFLLLGVVFFADRGKIHNTIVNNDTNMNVIKPEEDKCYYNPDFKPGICETKGSDHDVLQFTNHQKIIPGKIYYGLDFTDDSIARHYGITYSPHYFPKAGSPCEWGDGKSVGRCIRNGKPPDDDVRCPSKKKHIVEAWQRCAILCNDAKYCLTFTVKLHALFGHYDFNCYFHGKYVCEKNDDNQSVGIDHYVPQLDHEGVWSGICRTISGRTSDYACSKTPIPKKGACRNCDNSQPCCDDGGGFDFSCPGCRNGVCAKCANFNSQPCCRTGGNIGQFDYSCPGCSKGVCVKCANGKLCCRGGAFDFSCPGCSNGRI